MLQPPGNDHLYPWAVSTIDLSDGVRLAWSSTVVDAGSPIMESVSATPDV
jgi:hypothetical protein